MDDVLDRVLAWRREGRASALATIVAVERKAPRGPGAAMAVSAGGEVAGSLSGGCVEPAVVDAAAGVIGSGEPRLLSFGIGDDDAFAVGLACGGTIHVFLEPTGAAGEVLDALAAAIAERHAVVLATVLAPGSSAGSPAAKRLVFEDGSRLSSGSTGDPALDREIDAAAPDVFRVGDPERRTLGEADVFLRPFLPPPVVYVVGAVHPAAELSAAAKLAGYRVVVLDPRSPFATAERLPAADEIVREWPNEALAKRSLGVRDAVCVLTHDLKFDVPALAIALASPAGYVGAMGSKKTQAGRVSRLRELGVSDADLARIHAPIGLAIGAETPGEIALSIVAQIVAERRRAGS